MKGSLLSTVYLLLVIPSLSQEDDKESSKIMFSERPRQFRMSDPVQSVQTSESLSLDLSYPPTKYVPLGGCGDTETLCVDTEEYLDHTDLLNILNSQGEKLFLSSRSSNQILKCMNFS